jgi:peptide/nickel transport system substrate-binding protein
VSKAIDRDALIAGPLHGFGYRNWSTMTAGNPRWYDSTLVGVDDDPEGAKRLLAGLGMRDRNGDGVLEDAQGHEVAFDIITNADNPWRQEMVNLIRDDLAKVGIRATLTPLDFNTLISRYRSDFGYDACLLGQGSAVPADPGMGQNVWRSSGSTHYWHVREPKPDTPAEAKVDELMQRLVYTHDVAKRKADWHELMQIVNDQCWLVWLPIMELKLPVRSSFGNVAPSPMPHRILWNSERIFQRPGAGGR